jgi:hypothetical protein
MSSMLLQWVFLGVAVLASGASIAGLWFWSHGKTRTGATLLVAGQAALLGLLYLAWRLLLPDGLSPGDYSAG